MIQHYLYYVFLVFTMYYSFSIIMFQNELIKRYGNYFDLVLQFLKNAFNEVKSL